MGVAVKLLLAALAVYALLVLLMFLFQSRLVFLPHMPGRGLVATPAQVGLAYEDLQIATADGEKLHGWWLPHPDPRGTLLFSHGNAGNISHRLDSLRLFHDLGLEVLIYDYRGYGRSSGRASEAGVYRDAEAAWRWLLENRGRAPERIVLFGRSLGGTVTARLATRVKPAAVILESSFTSLPDLAADLYGLLPVRSLSRIRLDTREYVAKIDAATLIVHSRDDEIVPYDHARKLVRAANAPADLLTLSGGHNTGIFESMDSYRAGLDRFLERCFGTGSPGAL